ncbi:MAG: hypothetical protein FJZ63_07045 [Chlamydiae bacterium]|nr:hypothetical protein [Chlamydiota bacterium]
MKLKNIIAFEKQLREAAPAHFSKIYVVIVPDPFERRHYVNKLFSFLRHYRPKLELKQEVDLFSEEVLILLEKEEKPPKGAAFVIYALEKCSDNFYDKIEKDAVCLDLTSEKPWERKERLVEEVQKIAHPKKVSLQIANKLVDQLGNDLSALKNEVEKLCTFAYDRKSIEESDLHQLTTQEKEMSLWQMAEALVWRQKKLERANIQDLSDSLALFALVRHHLNLAVQICRGEKVASLRKNQLDIYMAVCEKKGLLYFIERLVLLFEWEVKAKSTSIDPTLLWDLFVIHYDTLSTAQLASSRS